MTGVDDSALQQVRSQTRRRRILDAAQHVFATKGYRGALVDDIAAESETSKGGVYFHFPNKGAIFDALLRRTAALLMDRVDEAITQASPNDPVARADRAVATALRLFGEHRTLARLFLIEAPAAGPEFHAALQAIHDDVALSIARHLDDAVAAGAIPPLDTRLAGAVWFGALNEVVIRWLRTGVPRRLEDASPALREMFLRSIGAGAPQPTAVALPAVSLSTASAVRDALRQGVRAARSREGAGPTVVSSAVMVRRIDALDLFTRARVLFPAGDRAYWGRRDEGSALVALGAATVLDVGVGDAARAWAALMKKAVMIAPSIEAMRDLPVGPILLGGFAFDPLRETTPAWADFGAGRLVLPRMTVATRGEVCLLTATLLVSRTQTSDDVTALVEALVTDVEALLAADSAISETTTPAPSTVEGVARLDAEATHQAAAAGVSPVPTSPLSPTFKDVMERETWQNIVEEGAAACRERKLEKVVLARAVQGLAGEPIDAAPTLRHLHDAYPSAYVFAVARDDRDACFLGATPERLVRLFKGTADVACLAGSTARGATPEEDRILGDALLRSPKDRAEHARVVETVTDALRGLCDDVATPSAPVLLRLANVQHLYTPVTGRVRPGVGVLDLAATLHPTPAVGGLPRAAALAFIRAHEGLDRGWYAGPVGWVDRHGEGEFAVALRSGLLRGPEATLYAGCGIVDNSSPSSEYDETVLKLRPMREALSR